jgi:hypothetical protein
MSNRTSENALLKKYIIVEQNPFQNNAHTWSLIRISNIKVTDLSYFLEHDNKILIT